MSNKDNEVGDENLDAEYQQWKAEKERKALSDQMVIASDEEVVMAEATTETVTNKDGEKEAINQQKILTKKEKLKKHWLSESMLNAMLLVFMSALLTLLCLLPVGYLMYKKVPKPMGIIDIQAIVNENQRDIVAAFSNSEFISEEQKLASLEKARMFTERLNDAVEEVSEECECVLINKAAVLTEAKSGVMVDYTDKVRNKVKR